MSIESLAADLEKNGIGFRVVAASNKLPTIPPLSKWDEELGADKHVIKYTWSVVPKRSFIEMYRIGSEWRVTIHNMDKVKGFEFLAPMTKMYGTMIYIDRRDGELSLKPFETPFHSEKEAYSALKTALLNKLSEDK